MNWISVTDELPEEHQDVLVLYQINPDSAHFPNNTHIEECSFYDGKFETSKDVTHWTADYDRPNSYELRDYQSAANMLWEILDKIDTLSDAIKPKDLHGFKVYYNQVNNLQAVRHSILEFDGYKLSLRSSFLNKIESVLKEVKKERVRQQQKWGEQNHNPFHYLAILVEEVGEASQAAVQAEDEGGDWAFYRKELIEVAAVAVAMIECYDRNLDAAED